MNTAPIQFQLAGKTYPVAELTQEIQGHFERWIEQEELLNIQEARDALGPAAYSEMRTEWAFNRRHGAFEFGTPISIRYLKTDAGLTELLWYCFSQYNPLIAAAAKADFVALVKANPDAFTELFEQLLESKKKLTAGPG